MAGEIGGDLAGDVGDGGEYVMRSSVRCIGRWIGVFVGICFDGSRLSGSNIFALAVEVSFDGSDGLREFFSDEFGCEAWPSGEVAMGDGFDPGRWDRASTGGVQVGDQVDLCRCMVGTVCMVLRIREDPRWLSRLRLCWSWLEGHFS